MNSHQKYIVLVVIVALSSPGCMRIGRDFPIERVGEIEKGKSTKDDVRRILGDPSNITLSGNGAETWVYSFTEGTALGTGRGKRVSVSFDASGIVSNTIESRTKLSPGRGVEKKSSPAPTSPPAQNKEQRTGE